MCGVVTDDERQGDREYTDSPLYPLCSIVLSMPCAEGRLQGCEDSHLYAVHPTNLKRFQASSEPRRVTVELGWAR